MNQDIGDDNDAQIWAGVAVFLMGACLDFGRILGLIYARNDDADLRANYPAPTDTPPKPLRQQRHRTTHHGGVR